MSLVDDERADLDDAACSLRAPRGGGPYDTLDPTDVRECTDDAGNDDCVLVREECTDDDGSGADETKEGERMRAEPSFAEPSFADDTDDTDLLVLGDGMGKTLLTDGDVFLGVDTRLTGDRDRDL